jgi:hypothetical protein
MPAQVKRLLPLVGLLYLIGILEGLEVARQRRRLAATTSGPASPETTDRDPASCRLLALTWWPAGLAALATSLVVPQLNVGQPWRQRYLFGGIGAEEHELTASLPGYGDFAQQRARLVPGLW